MMAEGNPVTPKKKIAIGAAVGAVGVYFVLVGLGLLPPPSGPGGLHAPLWVVVCIGLVFLLAGIAVFIQGVGRANDRAELPSDAPDWMRAAQAGSGVAIFFCFALIASWIAFGPGPRAFSGNLVALDGQTGVTTGRVMFGISAAILWLCTLGFAISIARKLMRRRGNAAGVLLDAKSSEGAGRPVKSRA